MDRDLQTLRLLVVDDDRVALGFARRVCVSLGIRAIHVASTTDAALEILRRQSIDVVLVDLGMSGGAGITLLRSLGLEAQRPAVVLLNAVDQKLERMTSDLAATHGLLLLGSLRKPIVAESLSELLHRDRGAAAVREHSLPLQRLTLEEVATGLAGDCLEVVYQPKVAIASGLLVGVEALARWRHPSLGELGPDTFVPVAEQGGLMERLTERVLRQAYSAASEWLNGGLRLTVAVNVSVEDLNLPTFADRVLTIAAEEGLPVGQIVLEVTETRLMEGAAAALETLSRLRTMQVSIAIDDFGTGYSSLKQLRHIPGSELKIDQAFVTGAHCDAEARAMLHSTIQLGHALGLTVTAEGVEEAADWRLLGSLGCDMAQGFLIAGPMPRAALPGWAQTWASSPLRLEAESAVIRTRRRRRWAAFAGVLTAIVVVLGGHALWRNAVSTAEFVPAAANSIAVLPFVNMSGDPTQEYFSDGMTEQVIDQLAQLGQLRVTARTSSFYFKNRSDDLREVGRTLGVANVLEGSLRKEGDRIRVTVQLIRTVDRFHLWSQTYDRALGGVFAIQDDIAAAIVAEIGKVFPLAVVPAAMKTPTDPHAYERLLLAKSKIKMRNQNDLEAATMLLDDALSSAPDYVPALVARAQATMLLIKSRNTYGPLSRSEACARARPDVEKSLRIEPDNGRAYAVRGLIESFCGTNAGALSAYERALMLVPSLAEVHIWITFEYGELGRWQEKIDHFRKAFALDPLSPIVFVNQAEVLVGMGQRAELLALSEQTQRYFKNSPLTEQVRAIALASQGEFAEAVDILQQSLKLSPDQGGLRTTQFRILTRLLDFERAATFVGDREEPEFLWARGDASAAVRAAEKLHGRAPVALEFRIQLALREGLAGQPERVIELLGSEPVGTDATTRNRFGCSPLTGGVLAQDQFAAALLGHAYHLRGRVEELRALQDSLRLCLKPLEELGARGVATARLRAFIAANDHDADEALRQLEIQWAEGDRDPFLGRYPFFDFLDGDPRWASLKERHLAAIAEQRRRSDRLGHE